METIVTPVQQASEYAEELIKELPFKSLKNDDKIFEALMKMAQWVENEKPKFNKTI